MQLEYYKSQLENEEPQFDNTNETVLEEGENEVSQYTVPLFSVNASLKKSACTALSGDGCMVVPLQNLQMASQGIAFGNSFSTFALLMWNILFVICLTNLFASFRCSLFRLKNLPPLSRLVCSHFSNRCRKDDSGLDGSSRPTSPTIPSISRRYRQKKSPWRILRAVFAAIFAVPGI